MRANFSGIYPVLFTFFDSDGRIDEELTRAQIDVCLKAGAHGFVLSGFVSQFHKLTLPEKIWLTEMFAEEIKGRVPWSLTLTDTSIVGQKELVAAGDKAGASWFIAQPAVKFPMPEECFYEYFLEIAAMTETPIAIQNAPDTGVYFSGAFLDKLNQSQPNICMIKGEGTTAQSLKAMRGLTDRYTVFSGQHGQDLLIQLAAGARGSVPSPLLCDAQVKIFELWEAGDEASRQQAQDLLGRTLLSLHPLTSQPNFEHGLPLQKLFYLNRIGLGREALFDRHPWVKPSEDGERIVAERFKDWGPLG